MTIAFMGGEMSAFLPSDSTSGEITSGGIYVFPFDSNFSRCGMNVYGNTPYVETPQFAALTECWTHIKINHRREGNGTTYYPMIWENGSNVDSVRLVHNANVPTVTLEYWDGAAWVSAATAVSLSLSSGNQDIDVRILCNTASGNLSLYVAGTERINASVDLSGTTSIRKLKIQAGQAAGFNSETRFSQVVIADASTIGYRLGTCYMSGAGATSSWTGTYTDIDEVVYADADFINSAAANQVSTFAQTSIPTLTGYVVRAVCVSARAKRGSSGPANIRMALRSSGTDYFSGSDIALGLGYTPVQTIWETNPATSAAWVNTAVAALQPGAKSIT